MRTARSAVEKLLVRDGDGVYCQPCLSPVWDTALACHALMDVGDARSTPALGRALDWLAAKQVLEVVGDWAAARPGLRPGGWAFQYENPHYPDVDDTAAAGWRSTASTASATGTAIARAAEWIVGMQSKNGGWGSFDADNTHYYLNHIPFADHGALLDPPTADVSARCLGFLAQLGVSGRPAGVRRRLPICSASRRRTAAGSAAGAPITSTAPGRCWPPSTPPGSTRRARRCAAPSPGCCARQHADGGWGESGECYWPDTPRGQAPYSTASQTAWALLGLMAAGEVAHPAVERGIDYLTATQNQDGGWDEPWYTAVGFPRVFYLRYHGYRAYFPLWALARYRRLTPAIRGACLRPLTTAIVDALGRSGPAETI